QREHRTIWIPPPPGTPPALPTLRGAAARPASEEDSRGAQMVDPDRGLGGDFHAAARHHRRQRRAALDPALAALLLRGPAMGRQRLCADARRVLADGGRARGPAGAPADLHAWSDPLYVLLRRLPPG